MISFFRSVLFTFFLIPVILPSKGQEQYPVKARGAILLHGTWQFAIDPADVGAKAEWFTPAVNSGFDRVTVPHCFTVDPRFAYYTGTAWYRKHFNWVPEKGKRVLLNFDAVFYKADIWMNGKKVGAHEGGYTPFHFDVTGFLKNGENLLVVSVSNNTWKHGSIPGAKDNNLPNYALPGWLNFGGITRPVYMTVKEEVYTENLKIESKPDLSKGSASLKVRLRIRNTTGKACSPEPSLILSSENRQIELAWKSRPNSVPPGKTGVWEAEATLPTGQVRLWGLDSPHLYHLSAAVGNDTVSSNFGIRSVEVSGYQLLLNGQPLRAAGGNRVIDFRKYGSLEPGWLIEQDFRLMKEAGMELHRLTHYTPSEYFYDMADKYGMLIITEAGNWQISPGQMDSEPIRDKFKKQFREMAERDWNHPSVFAYSVGNEYLSEQPAGQRWTKDMIDFARELDPTRLYTFATMRLNILPEKPEDEASQYVDFICANIYGGHARTLDHIHKLYPGKPVVISEWGMRADAGGEAAQGEHISDVVKIIRERPYVAGASWWSFNDYESRFQGTDANGLRPWGIVTHDRGLRPAYAIHQREMAVVTIQKEAFVPGPEGNHQVKVRVTARENFPSYPVKGYTIGAAGATIPIPDLQPGESAVVTIPVVGFGDALPVKVLKPTGFTILEESFTLD